MAIAYTCPRGAAIGSDRGALGGHPLGIPLREKRCRMRIALVGVGAMGSVAGLLVRQDMTGELPMLLGKAPQPLEFVASERHLSIVAPERPESGPVARAHARSSRYLIAQVCAGGCERGSTSSAAVASKPAEERASTLPLESIAANGLRLRV